MHKDAGDSFPRGQCIAQARRSYPRRKGMTREEKCVRILGFNLITGLNGYLYYSGGIMGPQNPILVIQAPILVFRVSGAGKNLRSPVRSIQSRLGFQCLVRDLMAKLSCHLYLGVWGFGV